MKRHWIIGSVSHGTMRVEDLIPQFLSILKGMKPLRKGHRELISQIEKRMSMCRCNPPCVGQAKIDNEDEHLKQYYASEDADYDLYEELFQNLNEYAPPYFYFGEHPEDGSDFGFWLEEAWQEFFDGWIVDDNYNRSYGLNFHGNFVTSDWNDIPKGYTGEIMHINDHGNMTLYKSVRGRKREVWSLV